MSSEYKDWLEDNKKELTGRLENWSKDSSFNILWGNIYDDQMERWEDGQIIHTSDIKGLQKLDLKEGDIVQTLNSRYLLGKPYANS